MSFLPIAIRELRVTARRPMTYWWRSLCSLQAACITLGFLLAGFNGLFTAGAAGRLTFQIFSLIGYGIAAVTAGLITSDCISQERREGTLGLLFLTDLKGYDIILGKLARLSLPVSCLIAAFPALGFTMLLGGITLGDFAKVALALVNTIFFFSALGLLISARSWNGRAAMSWAMAGAFIFSAPMLAVVAGLRYPNLGMPLFLLTPAGAFLAALNLPSFTVPTRGFLASLAVSHALGWLFIVAAGRIVARTFSREGPQPISANLAQNRWRPLLLLAALVAVIGLTARWISPTRWFDIPTFGCIVLVLHLILKFWTAQSACRCLTERRQSGELEMLLTTPLDGDAILLGSTTALKRQLLRPFLFVAGVDGVLLLLGWHKLGLWLGFPFAGAMLLECLWFIGNLYSLAWVGLWMGLKYTSHAEALGRTLFCILFLPWSVLAASAVCVGILTMGKSFMPWMGPLTALEFLAALAVCNLGFTGWAVCELRDRFRLLAASQPPPRAPFAWRWKRSSQTA